MATSKNSRQCSKCKDNVGSFNCEGCKEIFCTRHSLEHRQQLNNQFEQLMTGINVIVQQAQDNKQQNESFKKDFHDQIEDWENNMIEQIRERGKQLHQQLDELVTNRNKTIINTTQSLANEVRERHEKEDFLEHNIEQIKQNISQLEEEINNSTKQSDIKLHIESNNAIDWNHLIYFQENSNTKGSSVTNKQKTKRDTSHSNTIQNLNTGNSVWHNPQSFHLSYPSVKIIFWR